MASLVTVVVSFSTIFYLIRAISVKSSSDDEQLKTVNKVLDQAELLEQPNVRFTRRMTDRKLVANQPLELKCEAIGVPPPIVTWLFNDRPMDDVDHHGNIDEKLANVGLMTIQTGVTVARLNLPCVNRTVQGVYTCVADNGHQQVVSKVAVKVVQGGFLNRCPVQSKNPSISAVKRMDDAARIHMWTEGRFERTGASVQLYCRAKGTPKPSISWLDDRQQIVADMTGQRRLGFQVLENGDLMIHQANWDSMGVYTCIAKNDYGEDRVEVFFYPTSNDENE